MSQIAYKLIKDMRDILVEMEWSQVAMISDVTARECCPMCGEIHRHRDDCGLGNQIKAADEWLKEAKS